MRGTRKFHPIMAAYTQPVLEALDLGKDYPNGAGVLTVLDGLDLSVKPGEKVVIVGRSGCGKTTLLQCLGLLDNPTRGKVALAGEDASKWSRKKRDAWRAQRAGFVFQHYPLLDDFTVLENVALARRLAGAGDGWRQAKAESADWLSRVGMADRLSYFPASLSGGERQRCAIARALVIQPSILLCDEPTGSLDVETANGIMAMFDEIASASNAAVVMVTHDIDWTRNASRVLRLEGGKLVPASPSSLASPASPASPASLASPASPASPASHRADR